MSTLQTSKIIKKFQPLFILAIFGLFASCSQKNETKDAGNLSLAANRRIGLVVKSSDSAVKAIAESLFKRSLEETYGSKIYNINLIPNAPLESADNLYEIARNQIDDLFVVEAAPAQLEVGETPNNSFDNNVTIYNGENLRVVNIFKMRAAPQGSDTIEKAFANTFKTTALRAFPNPNIYPRANPKHYADLLYVFSEQQEANATVPLTCENASERLKYYKEAREIYSIALEKGVNKTVGAQDELHQLTTRHTETTAKVKVIDECIADQGQGFGIKIDYGTINKENQTFIQTAFDSAHFDTLLKQYTNKPVTFRFQVESNGSLSLFVELRFDMQKYRAWTANRIPSKVKNYQILSLDPYFALMQKLIYFRVALPTKAPFALRSSFETMRMGLNLKTILNGEVSLGVDGKYDNEQKAVRMAYPNSVVFTGLGFGSKTINNKDHGIFQEKAWIALGNCKTIEGTKTEDGLLYDFFGFNCQ